MARLPRLGPHPESDPHVVILGAGASRAACPSGDRHGRKLPVMADLVDVVGLGDLLADAGLAPDPENFEVTYDALVRDGKHPAIAAEIEERVRNYFRLLELPPHPTVYDALVLGLRPNDLIATFNWDPLLVQAYRRNSTVAHLPQLVFLHGVAGQGYCFEHRRWGEEGAACDVCRVPLAPMPLLYPVRDKNYTDNPVIARQWGNFEFRVAKAFIVTIFGYSAPKTDAAARAAMLNAWQANAARELAEIEIIDIRDSEDLHRSWDEFITRAHYGTIASFDHSLIARFPRRSCEGLASAILQNAPWRDNRYPTFVSLGDLQEWVQPLVDEERALDGSGAFCGAPCPQLGGS
jgi:hypothetical protein